MKEIDIYYTLLDSLAMGSELEYYKTGDCSLTKPSDNFVALYYQKKGKVLLINHAGFIAKKAMAYIPVGSDVMYPIIAQWFEDRYGYKVKEYKKW